MKTNTRGPWDWFVNAQGHAYLATPNRGHLIVMDFVRKGMNAAQPRFATWNGDERENMGGIMVPADKMTREGFAAHPDARLIATAPDNALLLRALIRGVARWEPACNEVCVDGLRYGVDLDNGVPVLNPPLRAALEKAVQT